ncbi:MAG: DJ-1/PfpI family protein [Pseudomonadota bacterium]
MSAAPRKTLGAVLYPDFELLDLYGPLEMFGSLRGQFEIVCVAEHTGPVRSYQGPETLASVGFTEAPAFDLLLVPGGMGTVPQLENPALAEFLVKQAATAKTVMSVCTGSALLAKCRLLDGRRATSNKMFFSLATNQSSAVTWVEAARWVVDGPFVTSSGVSAGTDMALAVIAAHCGDAAAEQVARFTEYQWHRDAATDPFVEYLNQADLGALA